MSSLRESLRAFVQNWRDDLAPLWRKVLEGVEPDVDAVDPTLELHDGEVIFPGRKGSPVPGAAAHAHVFRALDDIEPQAVRAVILGQDPYPKVARATGRAFDQGDLLEWPSKGTLVAESLRRIVQTLAAARTGRAEYVTGDDAWTTVANDLAANRLELLPPRALFDDLQQKGVLFLNAGLTLSRFEGGGGPEQRRGHIPFWQPIIRRILTALAVRKTGSVVYLLWGKFAGDAFDAAGVRAAAEAAQTWEQRVGAVTQVHPGAEDVAGRPLFFRKPNPFLDANRLLERMGRKPISW